LQRKVEIRIAGLGGQGVVLASVIVGKAAVYDGKTAVQTQSYGAEARGSAAKGEVIIADEKVNFPKVRKSDILVAMNQEALNNYISDLKDNGILILDKDLVKKTPAAIKAKVFEIPATTTAEKELGSKIYANMIMLGALVNASGVVSKESLKRAIAESVPRKTLKENLKAFSIGFKLSSKISGCP